MIKNFIFWIFFIGNMLSSFSKNDFQLHEIDLSNFDNSAAKVNTNGFRFDQMDYLVIQPKNNSATYLKENGIDVQSYIGDGYYLIASNSNNTEAVLHNISVSKMGYILPISKIDEYLREAGNAIPIKVLYASAVDINVITVICQKIGISVNQHNLKNHHFSTYATYSQMQQLAQYPFVYYITKSYLARNPLIYDGGLMMGANAIQEVQPFGYNLKGENTNVGIWDDGAVGNHFDLPANRSFIIDKERNTLANMAHPTEVGGCVGNGGNYFLLGHGIAPKCHMYFWDFFGDIVNEIQDGKTQYDIDVSNHSYNFSVTTCFESGTYIPEASDLDKLVYENPTLLPVIAVGNSASANCASLTDTFSSIDIGFQGSKNVLTVGWLFSNELIVGNSGRGPTSDGRLKPELVAKGFSVQTTVPDNGFQVVFGSSYAAPQVAGLIALLYQRYKQQFGIPPSASLIKSILCNTATDLGRSGPDYTYGFGIPNAQKAVSSIENNLFYEDDATQNSIHTYAITIPANASKLNVTLNWTDKEGNPIASKSLVNDLDLKLVLPNGDTILPWKLDPAFPKNNALRGVDHLNNIEQITVDNILPGSYTVVVKGTTIPFGAQNFSVAFYAQERKIEITHPNGGEILDNGMQTNIRWHENGIDSLAKIEFSSDNGATWQTVANNVLLSTHIYSWTAPTTIVSNECLIKISTGSDITVSAAPFTVGTQINYLTITHTVCDRTVKINWAAVTGASAYKIYLFSDSVWINVGQTSLNNFTISNLTNGKAYLYSIATIKNGIEGNHSLANAFTPSSNVCTTINDVGVYAINKQIGGREFTTSALTATEKLSFIVKNYGTALQNFIPVFYKINGGVAHVAALTDIVPGNDTSVLEFTVIEDLSAVGNYDVIAWTNLSNDNNRENDTLKYTIRQLQNAPLSLPYVESFEATNELLSNSTFGISGIDYIDYYNESGGRFRSNESNLYAKSGNRAITLDNYLGVAPAKKNELIFTFNLSNYTDSLIYLDFNYMNRAESDSNDILYARGDDTKPWIRVYDLFTNRGAAGKYQYVSQINLYQKLKVENNQLFSSSTQLKIMQSGTKAAVSPYGNGGYSFDDFRLYVAGKDVAVLNVSIKKVQCSKSAAAQPLAILIKNNNSQPIINLQVSYKVNNNTTITEIVPVINASDTLTYVFTTLFNYTDPGLYNIKAWVNNAGDNYRLNDSFNTTNVIVMQTVDSFPYYNDFEADNGNLFAEGINNSWIWGTPAKFNINNAAQDNKAWTTGLYKGYNFNENSYLYMGCLDFSTLTTDPMIAFDFISVMQAQSDSAYVEYSTDGISWHRLGCYNCGLNWYNGFLGKPYWDQTVFPWQIAHITVPIDTLPDKSNFMYRIHLLSDNYITLEGLGIDDIHVLKDYYEIVSEDSTYVTQQSTGNGWIQFTKGGKLVAELYDDNKNLGNISLGFEARTSEQKQFDNSNILPRNWVFKPQNTVVGNYKLHLYILNSEYTTYVINEDSINRMGDIGLLRYAGLNTNLDISDNHTRYHYKYYTPQDVQFYPCKNGYYVEFNTDTLGEFYLISTKHDEDAIQKINLIDFSAQKLDDNVYLEWKTTQEINSMNFVIQYSFDAATFIDVDTVPANGFSNSTTLYNYLHQLNATTGVYYYRIKIIDNLNKISYSLIDSVNFSPNVGVKQNITNIGAYISGNDIVIEFENKLQTQAVVNIYNSLGQLQFTKKMQLINGVNPLGLSDFPRWSHAAYYLQIQIGEHSYYSKLVKQ